MAESEFLQFSFRLLPIQIELISLIAAHRRGTSVEYDDPSLLSTSATLVVCPAAILPQWLQELARHAPSLACQEYAGVAEAAKTSWRKTDVSDRSFVPDPAVFLGEKKDVVIMSFETLASELKYIQSTDRVSRR
jgi:E3 ubiquitin-protein ligase SHPRH